MIILEGIEMQYINFMSILYEHCSHKNQPDFVCDLIMSASRNSEKLETILVNYSDTNRKNLFRSLNREIKSILITDFNEEGICSFLDKRVSISNCKSLIDEFHVSVKVSRKVLFTAIAYQFKEYLSFNERNVQNIVPLIVKELLITTNEFDTNIEDNISAQVALRKADEEMSMGNITKALIHYEEATKLYQSDGNNFRLANVFLSMSIAEKMLDVNSRKSKEYESQSIALLSTEGYEYDRHIFLNLARLNSRDGLRVAARQYFEKAEEQYNDQNDRETLATVYRLRGILESKEENNVDKAYSYLEKSKRLFTKIGDNKGLGKVYQSYGDIEREHGRIDKAISYYINAWKQFKAVSNQKWMGYIMGELYRAYSLTNNFKEAKKWEDEIKAVVNMPEHTKKYIDECFEEVRQKTQK